MSARRAAAHLPSRSIHLRIVPRPANLSESREIHRVLQRFGELTTYKHLKYEYHNPADNVALAIYRTAEGAQKALNASPVRFALEREVSTSTGVEEDVEEESGRVTAMEEGSSADLTRPSALLTNPPSTTPPPPTPQTKHTPLPFTPPAPRPTTTKWFHLTLDRSRAIHQDFIERQPLWKQFTPMKSLAQIDLAKSVPHAGLSDVSKRPPNAHRTPNKVLKRMAGWVEGMPSLKGMEEGRGR